MLSPEIESAVARLARGNEGIDAVMNQERESTNRFSKSSSSLKNLAESEGVPIAIIGGLAVAAIRYGDAVATQDIGVSIGKEDLARIVSLAPSYGSKLLGNQRRGSSISSHTPWSIEALSLMSSPKVGEHETFPQTIIPGPRQMGVTQGLD